MTRKEQIESGNLWQVFPINNANNLLFEGEEVECIDFITSRYFYQYEKGSIVLAKVTWEMEEPNQ